jgi:hypothetical protein
MVIFERLSCPECKRAAPHGKRPHVNGIPDERQHAIARLTRRP